MTRFISFVAVFTLAVFATMVWQASVRADEVSPMTEPHIAQIRSNCVETQSTLYQLHASDALLRVNRGQLYESISTKLMAPFNSRITLNKFDSTGLVKITTDYEQQLSEFRLNYQQYEEAMSRTLKFNCTNQPVAFYDSVNDTRTKRKKVHTNTVSLQKTIQDYKNEFETFTKDFQEKTE